ncbi:unnamed protein product [Rhizophagus irregularis]|nr:unnamed protein product [Rhizophagus irregularis]
MRNITYFLVFRSGGKWDQDSINGFRLLDSEVRISVRHVTTYNYKTLTALELNNSFRFLVFISSAIS